MKNKILIAISISICLISCSKNNKIQDEMERFYGQRVMLPLDSNDRRELGIHGA